MIPLPAPRLASLAVAVSVNPDFSTNVTDIRQLWQPVLGHPYLEFSINLLAYLLMQKGFMTAALENLSGTRIKIHGPLENAAWLWGIRYLEKPTPVDEFMGERFMTLIFAILGDEPLRDSLERLTQLLPKPHQL